MFWAAGDSTEAQKDAPMMAKILAAAGDYTLARKEDYIKRGCFPEWFAESTGKPAFEIAVRDLPHEPITANFEALYAAVEELWCFVRLCKREHKAAGVYSGLFSPASPY